jgi:hypothetical protein
MVTRHIVIVEDTSSMARELEKMCESAVRKLQEDPQRQAIYTQHLAREWQDEYAIHKFTSATDALQFLQPADDTPPAHVSLMLLDLHLVEYGQDFGGFDVLRRLDAPPPTIVVSAEQDQQPVIDSLVKFHAITFVPKSTGLSIRDMRILIEITLLYSEARSRLQLHNWWCIRQALALWDLIGERIETTSYRPVFPIDIRADYQQRVEDVTGLPNHEWSSEVLRRLLKTPGDWGTLYIFIVGLETFARSDQATDPNEVHKLVAKLLQDCLVELAPGTEFDFLGALRGGYLVVTGETHLEPLEQLIRERYLAEIGPLYNALDWHDQSMTVEIRGVKRKVPLMTLEFRRKTRADIPHSILDFTIA